MNAREEKRAAFNEQMNDWVSRQGLWFQLRHAADGQTIAARLVRVVARLALVVIVVLLLGWLYLVKRVEGEGFKADIATALEQSFRAKSCEVGDIRKERDMVTIASIKAEGDQNAFFHKMSARVIRLNMDLTDGFVGEWDTESVNISQLDLQVKAGDSDDAAAADSFAALFIKQDNFSYERIVVDQTNVEWGYSATNRGSISNSTMSVVRDGDTWNIEFKGGMFSQNWLKNLEIQRISVVCDKQGIRITEALLHSGVGTIAFTLNMGSGGQPQANGTVDLTSVPLKTLLPMRYHDWIEGTISGKGKISGSTNSQEGIVMGVDFFMGEGDVMILRDRLPLLSALSVVDLYNSYRKIPFTEGGFHIRTGGNKMAVSNIDMRSGNLLHIKGGDFVVRPSKHEEVAEALNIKDIEVVNKVLNNRWKFEDDQILESGNNSSSLSDAAKGVGSVVQGRVEEVGNAEKVLATSILTESRVRRFNGLIKVGLKRDAFDKAPNLKTAYPLDEPSGRIWVEVPLDGRLQTLTLKQAQRFYMLGKNRL